MKMTEEQREVLLQLLAIYTEAYEQEMMKAIEQ